MSFGCVGKVVLDLALVAKAAHLRTLVCPLQKFMPFQFHVGFHSRRRRLDSGWVINTVSSFIRLEHERVELESCP